MHRSIIMSVAMMVIVMTPIRIVADEGVGRYQVISASVKVSALEAYEWPTIFRLDTETGQVWILKMADYEDTLNFNDGTRMPIVHHVYGWEAIPDSWYQEYKEYEKEGAKLDSIYSKP